MAEVYNYYKMIRVQNKESKMNIQFPSLNMKKERGLRLVSSGRHNKVCHPFEIVHFLESRMKANFLLNPISSTNVSPNEWPALKTEVGLLNLRQDRFF